MKGQVDLMTAMAYAFGVIVMLWIITYIFQAQIFNSPSVQAAFNSSPKSQQILKNASGFYTAGNTVVAFIYIFIALGALVAATQTEANIAFAAFSILLLPVELVLSLGFHDVFFTLIQNSVFAGMATQYPFVLITFQYLPLITLALSFLIMIFTFSRG